MDVGGRAKVGASGGGGGEVGAGGEARKRRYGQEKRQAARGVTTRVQLEVAGRWRQTRGGECVVAGMRIRAGGGR